MEHACLKIAFDSWSLGSRFRYHGTYVYAQSLIAEFKKIDASSSGRITMEQALEYYRRKFAELDRNGDGFLDANELEAALPLMNAKSGKELLISLDRNSDGKLSVSEFTVIANWLFQLAKSPTQLTLSDVENG